MQYICLIHIQVHTKRDFMSGKNTKYLLEEFRLTHNLSAQISCHEIPRVQIS